VLKFDERDKNEVNEYQANFHSVTDHVTIIGNITYKMLAQISNIFKNIKSLDISGFRHELVIT
jgi:hypothetical protein